jgi:transposase
MRAYSVDLRQRVLTALDRGMARQQVVVTFGVSLATLKRWLVLRRTATALPPKTPSGRRRTIPVAQHAALWAQLAAHPDAPLAQHTQMWNTTHAVTRSYQTRGRASSPPWLDTQPTTLAATQRAGRPASPPVRA